MVASLLIALKVTLSTGWASFTIVQNAAVYRFCRDQFFESVYILTNNKMPAQIQHEVKQAAVANFNLAPTCIIDRQFAVYVVSIILSLCTSRLLVRQYVKQKVEAWNITSISWLSYAEFHTFKIRPSCEATFFTSSKLSSNDISCFAIACHNSNSQFISNPGSGI